MKRHEMKRCCKVCRASKTDVDWIINVEEVETVMMTWTDFVKYVKAHYTLIRTDKAHGSVAWVA